MIGVRPILALTAALLFTSAGSAVDLRKIDRTIAKEPAYKTKPKYCLLVFGPQAKTRVWLVQDGDVLYVDRNANGDLTEKDERVELKLDIGKFRSFAAGDIHDGVLTHKGLMVGQFQASAEWVGNAKEFARIKAANAESRIWTISISAERPAEDKRSLPKAIRYDVNGDGRGYLLFADRPRDAPIVHFNGPWSLGLENVKQRLTAGHQSQLQIGVGTPGVGPGTFAYVQYPDTIPADAYPIADIAFPAKSPGDKPIRQKYVLKERYGRYYMEDLVPVPAEAGKGMARIALSFDAWKDGRVSPTVVEVPVVILNVTDSKQIRATLRGHTDEVMGLAFTSDGATLASCTEKGDIKLWDTAALKERRALKLPGRLTGLAIAPDGTTLTASWYEPIDKDGRPMTPPYRTRINGYRGGVKLWDVKTGKERGVRQRSPSRGIGEIALSPDGKILAAVEFWTKNDDKRRQHKSAIVLWNVAAGKVRGEIPPKTIGRVVFAPDGKTLAIVDFEGDVILWDVAAGKRRDTLSGEEKWPTALAFSPDGKYLATANFQGTVTLWDVAGGEVKTLLKHGESQASFSLAFSSDGATLAVGVGPRNARVIEPGEVVLWDVAAAKKRFTLRGHVGFVRAIAFSADGKLLASGSADKTIKLWNVAPLAASKR